MPVFDRFQLEKLSQQTGFVRDNFEKVYRLTEILSFLNQDERLGEKLALKGGTAINLTIFDMPRLSVDIDLDYDRRCTREEMLEERPLITDTIQRYISLNGYALHPGTKNPHSLDSWVYMYTNAGGNRDNIKIEINYMMRNHILPTVETSAAIAGLPAFTVRTLHPTELFASKIKAFVERHTCRDLYDVYQMVNRGLAQEFDHDLLRKMVLFYLAVGGSDLPQVKYDLSFCDTINYPQIRATLVPMLRKSEKFDFEEAKRVVSLFLTELLDFSEQEKRFVEEFNAGHYTPSLLFDDSSIIERVTDHPMALWKMQHLANFDR